LASVIISELTFVRCFLSAGRTLVNWWFFIALINSRSNNIDSIV